MYILDKYKPKDLTEFHDQKIVTALKDWYAKGHNKPLLLVGPTGIGKTTVIELFAEKYNFNIYELSASDKKDKETLEKITKTVSKSSNIFGKSQLLVFDNIDVNISEDKGGFETIIKIAKETTNPIIFTANDLYSNKKMQKIREISEIIKMNRPSYLKIATILKNICIKENIFYTESAIKILAKESDGDIRAALLDLDALRPFGIKESSLNMLYKRERKKDIFKTISTLFRTKELKKAIEIRDSSDLDFNMFFYWIVENVHLFYKDKHLKEAYHYISLGDLNRARIYVRQNWTFLKYYIVLGMIAPAIIPEKDFYSYKINYPSFILKMSKETSEFARSKKIAEILQKLIHGSKKRIISDLEYYREIFKNNRNAEVFLNILNDDELEYFEKYFNIKLKREKKTTIVQKDEKELEKNINKKESEKKEKQQKSLFEY